MQKQILYPDFTTRLLANTIDFSIIFFLSMPLMSLFSPWIFNAVFHNFLASRDISWLDQKGIWEMMLSDDFRASVTNGQTLYYIAITNLVSVAIILVYLVFFISKFGRTPGKRLFNIKIVDFQTFAKPTIWQSINRSLFLWLGLICCPMIIFSKNKRGIHDKIASTLAIKT
jgi:uncharacterized RDD family membrane protein YckC